MAVIFSTPHFVCVKLHLFILEDEKVALALISRINQNCEEFPVNKVGSCVKSIV